MFVPSKTGYLGVVADRDRLENGAGGIELQQRPGVLVRDPDVRSVVERAAGCEKPVVTVVTVQGIEAPGVTIETEPKISRPDAGSVEGDA